MLMAVEAYKELKSGNAVAKRLRISPPTAYKLLVEGGVSIPKWVDDKPNRWVFTGDKAKAIVDDYKAGMKLSDLYEKHGGKEYAIRNCIKRAGVKFRDHGGQRRRVLDSEADEIVRLYEAGLSQELVGIKLKCAQTVVSHILRSRGIGRKLDFSGSTTKNGYGYIMEKVSPLDPLASMSTRGGYVPQHRLVMARSLNRVLSSKETVHHINGNREDNRIENLELRHGKHGKGVVLRCVNCGSCNISHDNLASAPTES